MKASEVADPRHRADRHAKRQKDIVRENVNVFQPFADQMVQTVRRGGRVLLVGEGPLHTLAEYCALSVVGRARSQGPQFPADPLILHKAGALATARCIGPFDALLAISNRCEEPPFIELLEAARARGAKVICLCVGPSRLEGRADVAIDVPEARPHRVPGLVATVLHYVTKLALAEIRQNPMIRPTRLDSGVSPSRTRAPAAAESEPEVPGVKRPFLGPEGDLVDEPTLTLEIPDDAFEIEFVDTELSPDVFNRPKEKAGSPESPSSVRLQPFGEGDVALSDFATEHSYDVEHDEPEEYLPPAGALRDAESDLSVIALGAGITRVIMFRCKKCREPLLAEPTQAGSRATCPFCSRRVKVPRSRGRAYRTGVSSLQQGSRSVALRFTIDECRLSIMPQGGFPIEARLADVTPEGIEATIAKEEAGQLVQGQIVRLRLMATAFLEPLVAVASLETVVPDDLNGEEIGRVRLLLPLADDTPRDVQQRLMRLAALADGNA